MADEHIDVPDFLSGEYTVRYRGPGIPSHAILTGDVLVVDASTHDHAGRLVVSDEDGEARVVLFEPGLTVLGVVSGVMRRLGNE